MLAEGFEVTDGCSPVSTTKWPAVGCVTRKAGQGTVHRLERGVMRPSMRSWAVSSPPARSKNCSGATMRPISSASTVTVEPSVPPLRGCSSGRLCAFTFMAGQRSGM